MGNINGTLLFLLERLRLKKIAATNVLEICGCFFCDEYDIVVCRLRVVIKAILVAHTISMFRHDVTGWRDTIGRSMTNRPDDMVERHEWTERMLVDLDSRPLARRHVKND